jgi:hypothetical protein
MSSRAGFAGGSWARVAGRRVDDALACATMLDSETTRDFIRYYRSR